MSIIWDPRTVLAIFGEDGSFTCVGTTQKGLRCKQAMFSGADRSEARQILDKMASRHPSSTAVRDQLSDLAYLTLCPRWHRKPGYCQVTQMVQKWQRAIDYCCDSIAPEVPTPRVRADVAVRPVASTAWRTSEPLGVQRTPSPPSDPAAREIRVPRSRRRPTILTPQPTPTSTPPTPTTPTSPQPTVTSTPPTPTTPTSPRPATASTTVALSTPPLTPTREHNASVEITSLPSTNTPAATGQNNRTTTNHWLPLTPPASAPSASPPTPCTQPHRVRRKPIDEDCAVCQEPICCLDEAVWCRAQCGQNIHRECFATWRRQSLRDARQSRMDDGPAEEDRLDAVKCVFCRAVWKWEWQD